MRRPAKNFAKIRVGMLTFNLTQDTPRARFLKKMKDWVLKSEKIQKWILRFLNRSIKNHSDHGASKEPKNPCLE